MKNKTKAIIAIAALIALLAASYVLYNILAERYKPDELSLEDNSFESVKTPAADFTVYDAYGNEVTLSAFKGKPVVVIRETQKSGQSYIDSQGYDFDVYFDLKQQAAATYGIGSIPATYFIDAAGYIVKEYVGAIDAKTLNDGIKLIYTGKCLY